MFTYTFSVNKGQEVQNRGSEAELGEVRTDGGIAGRNGFSKSLLVLKQKPLFIHTSFDPFTTAFYKFIVMFSFFRFQTNCLLVPLGVFAPVSLHMQNCA